MASRREFLKQAAGIALARRQVTVGGRRAKTVDIHAHCAIPEALKLMGLPANNGGAGLIVTPERLDRMDEQGIDVEALTINANWYALDRGPAREAVKVQNEKLAGLCASHPDRFVALATLACPHPEI